MKARLMIVFAVMAHCIAVATQEVITTNDGTVYENATVRRVEPDGITIVWPGGITKIPVQSLTEETRERHGLTTAEAVRYREAIDSRLDKQRRMEYLRNRVVENRRLVEGRVLEVWDDGLLVACEAPRVYVAPADRLSAIGGYMGGRRALPDAPPSPRATGTILLIGHPRQNVMVNGDLIKGIGFPAGRHTYRTAIGGTNTVRRLAVSPEMAIDLLNRDQSD